MKRELLTLVFLTLSILGFTQPAGSLDPTFGVGGKVVTSIGTQDKAYSVAVQSDDKILVAGFTTSVISGKDFVCVRYNADGALDNTFGTGGIVTTDLQVGSDDVAYSMALQADGKILLAGSSDDGTDRNAALIRYNSDGTIDGTFGTGGIVLTDFESNQQDEIRVVKVHALTGKIIVGGSSVISTNVSKPVVARYLSDGTLDNTFNSTGINLLWVTPLDYQYLFSVEDLVVQSSGKISAVGWRDFPGLSWDSDYWACRINTDGTMDNTFSTDGVTTYNGTFNGHDRAYSMHLKPDNNIVFSGGGYVSTLYYDFTMIEVTSTGPSTTWSALADFGSLFDDISYAIKEDVNGKFVMAGSSGNLTNKSFALSRKNVDATNDLTFGTSGKVTTVFGSNMINECFDMCIQTDNKILAVGYAGSDFAIARYLGNDVPDLDNFNLISPTNLGVSQNYSSLLLDWTDAFGATSYEVDVALDNAFTVSLQTYTVVTSSKTLTGLDPNTQYFWRVKASDGSVFGLSSATWSFTTNTLENFNLIAPANNAVNQNFVSLVFDWSNALGATDYELEIDSSITFSDNPATYATSSSATTLTNLQPETDYYWHVRASNNGTTFGAWSSTWKFTTKTDLSASALQLEGPVLAVYPSPATDFIYIKLNDFTEQVNYVLMDIAGNELATGMLTQNITAVSLENITSGTYVLQINSSQRQTFQIVKV